MTFTFCCLGFSTRGLQTLLGVVICTAVILRDCLLTDRLTGSGGDSCH